jgi:hypothetical protein
MEVVYPCCCGLDVHKKSITACVLWAEAKGKSRKEKRVLGRSLAICCGLPIGCRNVA